MIEAIDNVGICVADLARAVAFYERLGFTKAYKNNRGCTMIAGSAKLFLFQSKRAKAQRESRQATLFENPPGIDHISFLVANVDQTYAELKAKGVDFTWEPADQDRGRVSPHSRTPKAIICTSCGGWSNHEREL